MAWNVFTRRSHSLMRVSITSLVAASWILSVGGLSFAADDNSRLQDEAEIRKLTVCYALGTDAIGSGNLQAGKELYKNCFTPDATIAASFPNGGSVERKGPEAWADFVASEFRSQGYTATQHLVGTITVNVNGDTGTMRSYLHATHKLSETSLNIANGTYADDVIKTQDGWRIHRRTLTLITFLNLTSPPAPQAAQKKDDDKS